MEPTDVPPQRDELSDRTWIREAFLGYERPLLLYARRFLGDAERARDVVQETFSRLCGQPDDVRPRLAEWLYTVCRNAALDVRRKERVMKVTNENSGAGAVSEATPAESGPHATAARNEETERVLACLGELPPKQQEVLHLKFRGGFSYKEISRVTGESLGHVGWLIHMGLKALREKLVDNVGEARMTS